MHDLYLLVVIWVCALFAVFFAQKTRLTPVLWYLFFGALTVNLGLLPQEMPVFIVDFAELGIILIMFALGFEENTSNFVSSIKNSWGIAFFGALVPFGVAYGATLIFWHNQTIALMCGLAMTATAVSLTLVSLKSEGLSKRPAATGIMTSAVLDDIASLVLVAVMIPLVTGDAQVSLSGIALIVAKAVLFFVFVTLLGGWLLQASDSILKNIPIIGKFNLKNFLSMGQGVHATLIILIMAVSVSLIAHHLGFHPAVGAYMAGLVIKEEYFDFHPEKRSDFLKQTKQVIDNVAYSWIGPVFFVVLGAKLIFDSELFVAILPYAIMLTVPLIIGQVLSAGIAARYTGGFNWPDSWMIGFGMLGRAELAFVVMDIAYVQNPIFSDEAFYTLMITAFFMNVAVPISIRWWKGRFEPNHQVGETL